MSDNKKHEIKVYSTPTCPYCHTLKAFLSEKGFEFEDVDVAADEEARQDMVKKSGQMGVPVVDIDGQIVIGFDRNKIVEILNIEE